MKANSCNTKPIQHWCPLCYCACAWYRSSNTSFIQFYFSKVTTSFQLCLW